MPKPFYHSTEADLASGAENVVDIVTPVPATYGLSAPIVASYTTTTNSSSRRCALATTPATRTSISIENKNVAKKNLKAASVNLAKIITATQTVTNAMLLALRMNERVIPTPIPVWPTPPTIDVLSVSGRLTNFRVHDPAIERRGLPFARAAYIFSYVGPDAPSDPAEYKFEGETTCAKGQNPVPGLGRQRRHRLAQRLLGVGPRAAQHGQRAGELHDPGRRAAGGGVTGRKSD